SAACGAGRRDQRLDQSVGAARGLRAEITGWSIRTPLNQLRSLNQEGLIEKPCNQSFAIEALQSRNPTIKKSHNQEVLQSRSSAIRKSCRTC
ncbi:MAG: hypothetical protein WA858_00825, partial [Xanthobacteraceae bacterium]